jgi:hypothetical protein
MPVPPPQPQTALHHTLYQAHLIRSIILLALGGALMLLATARLRAYKLKERYALLFLFLALPFLVLAVYPKTIEWLAALLGISYFTVMLLCVSTFLFLVVFELLSIVSQQDRKLTTLAQMVAILTERQTHQERAADKEQPLTPS